jgi:hypothetical protein
MLPLLTLPFLPLPLPFCHCHCHFCHCYFATATLWDHPKTLNYPSNRLNFLPFIYYFFALFPTTPCHCHCCHCHSLHPSNSIVSYPILFKFRHYYATFLCSSNDTLPLPLLPLPIFKPIKLDQLSIKSAQFFAIHMPTTPNTPTLPLPLPLFTPIKLAHFLTVFLQFFAIINILFRALSTHCHPATATPPQPSPSYPNVFTLTRARQLLRSTDSGRTWAPQNALLEGAGERQWGRRGTGVYSLHPAESACDSGDAAGMAGIALKRGSF